MCDRYINKNISVKNMPRLQETCDFYGLKYSSQVALSCIYHFGKFSFFSDVLTILCNNLTVSVYTAIKWGVLFGSLTFHHFYFFF